jgi:hypothetical protein
MSTVEGLDRLVAELERGSRDIGPATRSIIQTSAARVKTDAQRLAAGIEHAPYYPASITYRTEETIYGAQAEIGPDKAKPQGALGNILEYGTSKNAPLAHLGPALDIEGPKFEQAMGIAVDRTLR